MYLCSMFGCDDESIKESVDGTEASPVIVILNHHYRVGYQEEIKRIIINNNKR